MSHTYKNPPTHERRRSHATKDSSYCVRGSSRLQDKEKEEEARKEPTAAQKECSESSRRNSSFVLEQKIADDERRRGEEKRIDFEDAPESAHPLSFFVFSFVCSFLITSSDGVFTYVIPTQVVSLVMPRMKCWDRSQEGEQNGGRMNEWKERCVSLVIISGQTQRPKNLGISSKQQQETVRIRAAELEMTKNAVADWIKNMKFLFLFTLALSSWCNPQIGQ